MFDMRIFIKILSIKSEIILFLRLIWTFFAYKKPQYTHHYIKFFSSGLALLFIIMNPCFSVAEPESGSRQDSIKSPIYYQVKNGHEIKFYRCVLHPEKKDIFLFSEEAPFQLLCKSSAQGKYIAHTNDRLYEVNMEKKTKKELMRLTGNRRITGFSFSHDGTRFAVSSVLPGDSEETNTGELWIGDTASYKVNLLHKVKSLGQYSSLYVQGWTVDDQRVILTEMGGDGGDIWGSIYTIAISKPKKVLPVYHDKNGSSYLLGELSPDGRIWLFTFCPGNKGTNQTTDTCEQGAELRSYNIETKKEHTIYKNLSHSDNTHREKLRAIYSFKWLDSENVVVTIADGLMRINVKTGKSNLILPYNWYDPDIIYGTKPEVLLAGWDRIILRHQGSNDVFILFPGTGKLLQLEKNFPKPTWGEFLFFR